MSLEVPTPKLKIPHAPGEDDDDEGDGPRSMIGQATVCAFVCALPCIWNEGPTTCFSPDVHLAVAALPLSTFRSSQTDAPPLTKKV